MIAFVVEFLCYCAAFYGIQALFGFLRNLVSRKDKHFVTEEAVEAKKKARWYRSIGFAVAMMVIARLGLW